MTLRVAVWAVVLLFGAGCIDFVEGIACRSDADCLDGNHICSGGRCASRESVLEPERPNSSTRDTGTSNVNPTLSDAGTTSGNRRCRAFPYFWRPSCTACTDGVRNMCTHPCRNASDCEFLCFNPATSEGGPCECLSAPPPWSENSTSYCSLSSSSGSGTNWFGFWAGSTSDSECTSDSQCP